MVVKFVVNSKKRAYKGPPFKRLIDVLRDDFGLTGTKEGCGEGECGACTVLIDGQPVNSCLVPVGQVENCKVETVESLGSSAELHILQKAFLEEGSAQCGFCTPGMLMTSLAWIRNGGSDKSQEIREYLAGNLCRCTGYQHIINAVIGAVREYKKAKARRKGLFLPSPRVSGERAG
ncbi:MAG: (2Fe-2S)-binding protein [Elusimicrobia bacterium]|nr:(2Fe-2S)-binding protein [Elusimicrobiota bacterium]